MTEKRFQWCERIDMEYVDEFLVDTFTNKELDEEDMCDLLNELNDENKQLRADYESLEEEWISLDKENNQLKKVIAHLKNKLAYNDQHSNFHKKFDGIEDWARSGF